MSFVSVKVAGPTLAIEQIRRLQARTTELVATELHGVPELTSVLIEQPAIAGWAVGGRPALVAAHIAATIAAGITTSTQKTGFIRAANTLLRRVLGGELSVATYVTIIEMPGDAWGYDGMSVDEHSAADASAAV